MAEQAQGAERFMVCAERTAGHGKYCAEGLRGLGQARQQQKTYISRCRMQPKSFKLCIRLSKCELPQPTYPTCSCSTRRRPAAGVAKRSVITSGGAGLIERELLSFAGATKSEPM
eukprot:scaffold23653_cov96-Phaeocystis_antarctica.AAC.3